MGAGSTELSYRDAKAIDLSTDDAAVDGCSAIYVGGGAPGDVTVIMRGLSIGNPLDASVTFKAVPIGTVLRVHARTVVKASTTATLLVALYS